MFASSPHLVVSPIFLQYSSKIRPSASAFQIYCMLLLSLISFLNTTSNISFLLTIPVSMCLALRQILLCFIYIIMCISHIVHWLTSTRLKINVDKTVTFLCGNKRATSHVWLVFVKIWGYELPVLSRVKLLGVISTVLSVSTISLRILNAYVFFSFIT